MYTYHTVLQEKERLSSLVGKLHLPSIVIGTGNRNLRCPWATPFIISSVEPVRIRYSGKQISKNIGMKTDGLLFQSVKWWFI